MNWRARRSRPDARRTGAQLIDGAVAMFAARDTMIPAPNAAHRNRRARRVSRSSPAVENTSRPSTLNGHRRAVARSRVGFPVHGQPRWSRPSGARTARWARMVERHGTDTWSRHPSGPAHPSRRNVRQRRPRRAAGPGRMAESRARFGGLSAHALVGSGASC
jgi:hypothetical protein